MPAGTETGGAADDRARIAKQFIDAIPHARALGMRVDELGPGKAVISMPWSPHLVGDPRSGPPGLARHSCAPSAAVIATTSPRPSVA